MPTHRVYGVARVGGRAVARRVDVVSAPLWSASGLEAAVVGSTVSDAETGAWSVDLDSDDLVYVLGAPEPPYRHLMQGPYRPEPI